MTDRQSMHLGLINALLTEKDRLIREKDELVDSKDKLWRELHAIVRAKDAENEALRQDARELSAENDRIRRKSETLERALKQLVDQEEEDGASGAEDEDEIKVEDARDPIHESVLDDVGYGRRFSDSASDSKTSQASLPPKTERACTTNKPQSTFAPLIRVTEEGEYETGRIENIAAPVVASIRSTLNEVERRHSERLIPAHPSYTSLAPTCVWNWATGTMSGARWTTQAPRTFACGGCFNARRACFMWLGKMKWMVLPLPPQVRDATVTPDEKAYYIYEGHETSISLPGIWQASRKKGKRKQDEVDT
ncbi:hypothetical protein LTR37_010968 [Vermiconidia calcicola]|uniref:Uncharacterized protein n=1 Tax=Vermiconidia calcicola TaxID=1690605 RepID=A0ACC3N4V1_9PEZI|nr:hypothetical protein LTR37_010968 [Vermiconidia calcicola]